MSRRATGLALILAGLALVLLLSVSVGARPIPVDRVWGLVWSPDGSDDAIIVHDLRIPRTILGLIVGTALGVGGALMQALTRNPLADPGLLGVNAGAAAAVVTATALLGIVSPLIYVWFAFAGAAIASVVVYGVGSAGRSGATPVRLALAGTAISFALIAYVQGLTLDRPRDARPVPLLAGRRAGRPPAVAQLADRAVRHRRPAAGVRARPPAERDRARRRGGAGAGREPGAHAHPRRGGDHAAVRGGDRGGGADRVRRPDRAARRARDHRPRPALGAALLARCSRR